MSDSSCPYKNVDYPNCLSYSVKFCNLLGLLRSLHHKFEHPEYKYFIFNDNKKKGDEELRTFIIYFPNNLVHIQQAMLVAMTPILNTYGVVSTAGYKNRIEDSYERERQELMQEYDCLFH